MRKLSPPALALAAMAFFAATAALGQSMNAQLKEAEAVPLDFLRWIDKDTAWLEQQIATLGGTGKPAVSGQILETTDVATLKAANRVRSFAYLAAKGLRPPYFDLTVATADGVVRCVTLYPYSIAPDIGPMDFARTAFPAEAADQAQLEACRVAGQGGEYASLDRQAFRERYFNASGTLKPEFRDLNEDPAFRAKAIDEGFFLTAEDYSGLLQLDER